VASADNDRHQPAIRSLVFVPESVGSGGAQTFLRRSVDLLEEDFYTFEVMQTAASYGDGKADLPQLRCRDVEDGYRCEIVEGAMARPCRHWSTEDHSGFLGLKP